MFSFPNKVLGNNTLVNAECIAAMKEIPDGSIDLVLCDLPYGTTTCKWDNVVPFNDLWEQYSRVTKFGAAVVLFGTEPFSSYLRLSNIKDYKYDFYWQKSRPGGFVNARLKPLKDIETISVFSNASTANGAKTNMMYNPQGLQDCNISWERPENYEGSKGVSPSRKSHALSRTITKQGYPRQVLQFANPNKNVLHPTQKPVDLIEYLVRTYSTEGMTVLDNTMGSGTTGVACVKTNRKFIGIEMDTNYFNIAVDRIQNELNNTKESN